ncbi:MAG: UDP-N-acetylglucosamine 1-carboxyvinyltransferase [uncultured Thermomicrobiales bacterium]|uniref:UDP-N-acetylglucosamine 1-carboxyvinyltransferase n=1 Tax=uncultured Thermomicrobiales bacterium TaxID=1645740 RepID=A0A6J4V8L0_9BACT|nr:MAG: UDP-N-acetylglucosamine 1-carboxyvinyltransferase [uncultured Thermomicrobiales bacterium]
MSVSTTAVQTTAASAPGERAIRIEGGAPLRGTVTVGGSKNLALPALAAALLTDEPCIFDNVPCIEDTRTMLRLLKALGATADPDPDDADFVETLSTHKRVTLRAATLARTDAPSDLAKLMRASFLVVGPLLARCAAAAAPPPGGDAIGARPLDVAIRSFKRMGATVVEHSAEKVSLATDRLTGAQLYLDYPSHTGTENLLMAASLASGTTTIINAACEPEVVALGNMLRRMGANIQGLGSPHVTVEGVSRLHGAYETIMPDRLVAGTFAIAAAITGGELTVRNVRAADMVPVTQKLREAGATVFVDNDNAVMFVRAGEGLSAVDVQALPFPGFPTDQQAVFAVLLTQANGVSQIHERVFEDRLRYTEDLNQMGAAIRVDPLSVRAEITGPSPLRGAAVRCRDIRAGAALVLAGLVAEGETVVSGVEHLDRGYEALVPQLRALGARISDTTVDAPAARRG